MGKTYNIWMSNCGDGGRTIEANYSATSYGKAMRMYNYARDAFRDVRLTDGETGEILLSIYSSNRYFESLTTVYSVLNTLDTLVE